MLPIHERFSTWQGEGAHMGRAAFFVRTFGCPQRCPWCDSAGTWHKDYVPKEVLRLSEEEIVAEFLATEASFMVVTGGEPAVHDLRMLTALVHQAGRYVHLETSGAYPIKGRFDWITVSPKDKWARPCLAVNYKRAHELKLIIEHPDDILYWRQLVLPHLPNFHLWPRHGRSVWLHPEWTKREDRAVLDAITNHIKQHGDPYRAGWQMHKLFRSDNLDPRTQPLVPLGGNPALGL